MHINKFYLCFFLRHESLPAIEEKYIVQMFGRVDRVPPPLGILDSFDDYTKS